MSKPSPITTALLRRILPGLRMMARFPTRPVQDVSFMTEVELSELKAYLEENPAPTDDAVKLLEYHLDKSDSEGIAPPWTPPAERVVAPVKLPIASGAGAAPKAKEYKWRVGAQKSKAARDAVWMPKYRAVAAELCANPWLKENTACKAQGVAAGTWCGFKLRTLGQSQGLDREALRKHFNLPPLPEGVTRPPRQPALAAAPAVVRKDPEPQTKMDEAWIKLAASTVKTDSARKLPPPAPQPASSQKLSITAPGLSQPFTIRITLELIPAGGES